MAKAAAKTGTGPTVLVAVEQHFPPERRLITDDLARPILPRALRAFVQVTRPAPIRDWLVRAVEKPSPGIWGGLMCRKHYIDDTLTAAVPGLDAVVDLGAGFDTRAYRLTALREMPVWEVDQRAIIAPKQARLQAIFGQVPGHVTLVPIDFDREALGAVLATHGYAPAMRTFFILEGVTQYLTESGLRSTFEFLSAAAPGSRLACSYVLRDLIEGRDLHGQKALYDKWVVKEQAWLYGFEPTEVPGFLGEFGWRVIEDVGFADLFDRYVGPTGRDLATTPIERLVYAEKR